MPPAGRSLRSSSGSASSGNPTMIPAADSGQFRSIRFGVPSRPQMSQIRVGFIRRLRRSRRLPWVVFGNSVRPNQNNTRYEMPAMCSAEGTKRPVIVIARSPTTKQSRQILVFGISLPATDYILRTLTLALSHWEREGVRALITQISMGSFRSFRTPESR